MTVLHHEHETTGAQLSRIRQLADQFQAPAGAFESWCALYSGLEELEFAIMQHINFEEHVLFPRGLQQPATAAEGSSCPLQLRQRSRT
ncbi:MAG TPA: hemerythrin domain-containing protein [Oligoflexus sp.]|uniref:hemerythrin domain-containing protein n=1 Tax=Oligoflexus sp. TaxID=1971216 RepID=UPI002D7488ED|nr:hemerythrin domain-containing protein [Oligoflexus sp.]HYX36369.1 hemerythrin domain-containing protein [Oligoflexus sp.]